MNGKFIEDKVMAGEDFSPESRRMFLVELYYKTKGIPLPQPSDDDSKHLVGIYQGIADELGVKDRRNVHNWVKHGFAHVWKRPLIELSKRLGVDVHKELYTKRRHNVPKETTPLSRFLHNLALKCGGFENLSKLTGIPLSSIGYMRLRKGRLRKHYTTHLEQASGKLNVPLPEGWPWEKDKAGVGKKKKDAANETTSLQSD
jgi:hypothetical protein